MSEKVANYAFYQCKILCLKIRVCKSFDIYHVWLSNLLSILFVIIGCQDSLSRLVFKISMRGSFPTGQGVHPWFSRLVVIIGFKDLLSRLAVMIVC